MDAFKHLIASFDSIKEEEEKVRHYVGLVSI